jgi:YaiO family outer membrane protein
MKSFHAAVALIMMALLQAPSHASERTSVGAMVSADRLSNRSPDWHESSLQLTHEFAKRHLIYLAVGETSRFRLRDTQLNAVYSAPLSERLTGTLDVSFSPTHRVLSKDAVGALLQYEFAPAWLLQVGGKQTHYNPVTVRQATLGLEHYFSSFSVAAGWRPARAFGTIAHGADLRAAYYYGDASSVGITIAAGQEAASVGSRVVLSDVRALVLVGRHWLNSAWSVNYAASHTRQDDFYTRNGVNIGVQYTY